MRGHHKAALIAAGIFGACGIGLCTAAMVIGINSGELQADLQGLKNRVKDAGEDFSDDLSSDAKQTADGVVQSFDDVSFLDIELNYAGMEIHKGTGQEIRVTIPKEADGKVRCRQKGDTLEISDNRKGLLSFLNSKDDSAQIYLTIPENMKFQATEIEVGTGELKIVYLDTEELVMNCGVGEIDFDGSVTGNADIDCGVGSISMKLAQNEKDFNYDIDCGVGSASIGEMDFLDGMGAERSVDNGAKQMMSVECGVGDIKIHFSE